MKDIKIIFMGTPDFSLPVLTGLIENYNVIAVVTQPDKKVGRKQEISFSPVKKLALQHNIKVLQPERIRKDTESIKSLKPDIIITCAYGQIIPKELLDTPQYGCINVHASLLPKLRGGAPIHKAIIEGYKETGITIMYMSEKMDQGDIISQEKTEILDSDNLESLHNRLSIMGKNLLLKTLPDILNNNITRVKQKEEEVTYAYNITHSEEKIDFNKTVREVLNQIRGLSPTPGAYTTIDGKTLKVYQASLGETKGTKHPGEVVNIYKDGIGVACKDGEIIIKELKPEGKKKMSAKDYLNGINKEIFAKSKME